MNLRNRSAWVRAAGLAAVMGLVACDGGAADTKKVDPAKAVADKAAETKVAADKVAADAKLADDARLAGFDGKALYESKCKSCHAIDGKGTVPMQTKNKIPNLTDVGWQDKHDKAKVIVAITDGVKDTKMQAFKAKLKPEEIEAIAVYVKGMK